MSPIIDADGRLLRQEHLEEAEPGKVGAPRVPQPIDQKQIIALGNLDFVLDETDPHMIYATCSHCFKKYVFSAQGLTYDNIMTAMQLHRAHGCKPGPVEVRP
jgi:hypothetical protein